MRKSILFCLFSVMLFFILTGCGNSNNMENNSTKINEDYSVVTIRGQKFNLKRENNLHNLYYKENYVDFHTDRIGDMEVINYTLKGEVIFEIRLLYDENRSISELKGIIETQFHTTEKTKEINGIKYVYYEYVTEDGFNVHHYIYEYNGKSYSIGIYMSKDSGNIEEVFMNGITFKS